MNDIRVFVACKTSKPSDISEATLRRFLQRATDFNPEIAVLLIDTDSSVRSILDKVNAIYLSMAWKDARLYNPALPSDARLASPTIEPQSGFEGVYWGARNIYITSAARDIDTSLSAVLRLYYSKVRHMLFLSGDTNWDFVAGEVRRGN